MDVSKSTRLCTNCGNRKNSSKFRTLRLSDKGYKVRCRICLVCEKDEDNNIGPSDHLRTSFMKKNQRYLLMRF